MNNFEDLLKKFFANFIQIVQKFLLSKFLLNFPIQNKFTLRKLLKNILKNFGKFI